MRYRPLGLSGLTVSEIGFGAWGIGGATPGATSYGVTDDAVSCAALEAATRAGINFFDTSNVYGDGHSERLLGRVFAKRRSEVIIATKSGFVDYARPPDFSPGAIRESLDGSLKRLDTDYVDLLQLHNPAPEWLLSHHETFRELEKIRASGAVRAIGISVKAPSDALSLLGVFPFQTVQANFNMLDIRVLDCGLLDRLETGQIGFIARTPMSFGFLSGAFSGEEEFPPQDHRSRWPRQQIRLWAEGARALLDSCIEAPTASPHDLALRYCLSFRAVSCTIPGMLDSAEVLKNARASDAGSLSPQSLQAIESLHRQRSFIAAATA